MAKLQQQVHFQVDFTLWTKWVERNGLSDGDRSERLRKLIEADTFLTQDEKDKKRVKKEIEELTKDIIEKQQELVSLKILLNDIEHEEEQDKQKKMKEYMAKAGYMKEQLQEEVARAIR